MVMTHMRGCWQEVKDHELVQLKRHIEKTDREIDERVYELYGLTEEEIRTIEKRESFCG